MKFLFTKSFWAKALGWAGAALSLYGGANASSKYGALALAAAPILSGWGIHLASQTSQAVATK